MAMYNIGRARKEIAKRSSRIKKRLFALRQKARLTTYNVRLKVFLGRRSSWVKIASHFINRKQIYLTVIYTAAALYATWLSGHYVLPAEDATAFFTAAGAMIGAALAIILTFNTLIINFASTEYPPEFYKATGYDWRQHIIYFLLAADATALFVFCLVFKSSLHHQLLWLFPLAVFIICKAFYLLFASYLVTRKRLDPSAGLAIIRKIAIKHLTKGAKAGDKLARVFATNPKLKPEDKAVARKEAYRIMTPLLEQVSQINTILHDYHDKVIAKQNFRTALRVLDTIYEILAKYIEIRRDNMQARVTPYFLAFTTDAQGFFEQNLQQLVDKAKRYMEAKNTTGAIHITDLMCSLAQHASAVEFGVPTENPLLDQVQGYINNITEEAIAKKDIEVLFHLADVYSVLGRQAVIKDLSLAKVSAYGQLVKIGEVGALTKQTSITGRVADAFNAILVEIHNHEKVYAGGEPKYLFGEYQKVLMLYCVAISGSQVNITNPQMLAPYNSILRWMAELANLPADKVDRGTHSTFTELAEVIRDSMRHMSGIIPLGGHSICVEMGSIIQSAASLILDLHSKPAWQSAGNELTSQAMWYIHQLTWFMEKTTAASEFVTRELVENAGYIGLRALETNAPEIAKASVEVISYLAIYFQNKAEKDNGYEPARFMESACLVGIYAKKLGMDEVYELAKTKANEFNAAFNRKHFPEGPPSIPGGRDYIGLHPDQLIRELNRLYAEPNYEYGIMPSESPAMLRTLRGQFSQHLNRDDVQAFVAEISPQPTVAPPASVTEPEAIAPTEVRTAPIPSKNPKKASKQAHKKKSQ